MSYADESEISDWAKSSVACMNVMGIMKGVSETEFSPKEPYTVEQDRHNRPEHVRPMLVKFPLSRSFGICKATALLHPAITSEQKFSGALGLRVQKEQIFCKKRQKRS